MKRAVRDPVVIAILVTGTVLTVILAVAVQRAGARDADRWLDERAEVIAQATEDTVMQTFADLRAVAAYLNSSVYVSQAEFSSFVEQMEMNPGVIGIGYVEVVAAADIEEYLEETRRDVPSLELLSFDGLGGVAPNYEPRETYYPLRYVYGGPFLDLVIDETPISSQIDALGFDLSTEPVWFPAFETALQFPDPSVSDLVEIGGVFEEKAFGAAHPVHDQDGSLAGVLVAPGLETLLTTDIRVSLTSNIDWAVSNSEAAFESDTWPLWQRHLDLPGSTWTLTVEPTDAARSSFTSPIHWVIVVIGLILTAALATTALQLKLQRRERQKVEQLQQLAGDKDRFLATVSHELRTPLTVVIGLAAELADDSRFEEGERNELLEMIEQHGEEAGAIVEDLLVAARSDIDKIAIKPEPVDPEEAVASALATSPVDEVSITGHCSHVAADPARLQQILRNLLANAHHYGGPKVEIKMSATGTTASITVADNGKPISAEYEQAIFDPYTSAHNNRDNVGSIGLGLFISQKLARLMDGDLTYRHDGQCALFELILPLATTETAATS